MKRKFWECSFIVVAVAAAGYIYCMSQKKSEPMSQLMLENIEALASDDESGVESGAPCYSDAKYDIDKPKAVKCGDPCVYLPLDIPWFASISYCQ